MVVHTTRCFDCAVWPEACGLGARRALQAGRRQMPGSLNARMPGCLEDRDLDLKVADRVGGAGVEPAQFFVHGAAAVADRGDENVS